MIGVARRRLEFMRLDSVKDSRFLEKKVNIVSEWYKTGDELDFAKNLRVAFERFYET